MAAQGPFFVVGAGRSGTTLLRLILNGHSRLHIPPETWFLRPLLRQCPLDRPLTQPECERAIGIMVRHERWPDMDMPEAVLRQQADALVQKRLVDLVDLVYAHQRAAAGKPRIGDKTPHYFEIVSELATLYPRARFIHLLRDGHDVAISWIDAGWQRYYEPGFEWPRAIACLQRDRIAFAERFHAVRYEDLVQRPQETVAAICNFLGEAFEPAMLLWHERTAQVAERDRHLHRRLHDPLAAEAIGVWRRRLSAAECFAVEACLHQSLRPGGYALRFDAVAWRPALATAGWMLRALAPVLSRVIPRLQRRRLLPRRLYL
jgi:hypothetical protein